MTVWKTLVAVSVMMCCGCQGVGTSVPGEPVAECIDYERTVANCYHREIPIANQPSMIPHTLAELANIRATCRANLARFKLACR